MNKVIKMLVVTLAFLLVLAGCSGNSNKQSSDSKDKETTSIKHAMGTTEIKGKPKRVVTLYQGATDVAVSLGVKPVGAVESWTQKPKFEYIKNDLKDTKIVGQEPAPNLEEISKLKPDLIVASKVRNEKVYDQLSKIAPTVSTDTVFKFKDTTKLMGKALGKEKEAEDLLKKYDDKVAAFQKDAKAKYKDAWPLKASVVNFRADHTRIYAGGYAGEILNDLGFKRNKDLQNAALVKKTESEWTSSKEWKNLDAVKNNQVSDDLDEITWNLAGGYKSSLKLIDDLYEKLNIEKQSK